MRQTLHIDCWRPTRTNELLAMPRFMRAKAKRFDAEIIKIEATRQGVSEAVTKRRLTVVVTCSKRGRLPDPDAYDKSLRDALVTAGLLVDDSQQWLEAAQTVLERGEREATTITLEDVDEAENHTQRV